MKFIRKNGRIIPISDKKDSPKKSGSIGAGTVVAGATAVTAATGKNILKGSAIAGGLLGLGALAGLYNKYKAKK